MAQGISAILYKGGGIVKSRVQNDGHLALQSQVQYETGLALTYSAVKSKLA